MEQVDRFLRLDIMSRQKWRQERKNSLGKFVSALRHKHRKNLWFFVMHKRQCRNEENYVKKDTVFLLEYAGQGEGQTGNYGNDYSCFWNGYDSRFVGKKTRYIKA